MSDEKVFANGFSFKRRDNAPDFVIGSLSVNVENARETFKNHTKDGWLNLNIKQSKGGKYYVEIDTWEPKKQEAAPDNFDDEIPF